MNIVRPEQFKHCMQEVLEEIQSPWVIVRDYINAHPEKFTGEVWAMQHGTINYWITDRAYIVVKRYVYALPIFHQHELFKQQREEVVFPQPEALINTMLLEVQIDNALAQGNKEEFMRLTASYKEVSK